MELIHQRALESYQKKTKNKKKKRPRHQFDKWTLNWVDKSFIIGSSKKSQETVPRMEYSNRKANSRARTLGISRNESQSDAGVIRRGAILNFFFATLAYLI